MTLVLLTTFLFSISAGICVSTISKEAPRAIGSTFAVLLVFALVWPACGYVLLEHTKWHGLGLFLSFLSPVNHFRFAADDRYSAQPQFLWTNFLLVGITALTFIALALWLLPDVWRENPKGDFKTLWDRAVKRLHANSPKARCRRERLLAKNPVFWLAARNLRKSASLWFTVGLGEAFVLALYFLLRGQLGKFPLMLVCSFIVHAAVKFLVAVEAIHSLADDRRSGALELLLSTPLGPLEVLQGYLYGLRRKFFLLIGAVLVVDAAMLCDGLSTFDGTGDDIVRPLSFIGAMLMLVGDGYTLSWVGLCSGLVSKSSGRALVNTIAQILILPWVGTFFRARRLGAVDRRCH